MCCLFTTGGRIDEVDGTVLISLLLNEDLVATPEDGAKTVVP